MRRANSLPIEPPAASDENPLAVDHGADARPIDGAERAAEHIVQPHPARRAVFDQVNLFACVSSALENGARGCGVWRRLGQDDRTRRSEVEVQRLPERGARQHRHTAFAGANQRSASNVQLTRCGCRQRLLHSLRSPDDDG